MKIHTSEQLEEALDSELAWRRKELTDVNASVHAHIGSTQSMLIRAGVALLYAHWEGGIKGICEHYLTFIGTSRPKYDTLSAPLLAIALHKDLRKQWDAGSLAYAVEIINRVRDGAGSRAKFVPLPTIDTKSNLTSSVLREVVISLGLNYAPFLLREKFIDESLVGQRNAIAHGEYLAVDIPKYDSMHLSVLSLLDDFRNQISNIVALKQFSVGLQDLSA